MFRIHFILASLALGFTLGVQAQILNDPPTAKQRFLAAEEMRAAFESLSLDPLPMKGSSIEDTRGLNRSLKKMLAAMHEADRAYEDALLSESQQWSIAAGFRQGEMREIFAAKFRSYVAPDWYFELAKVIIHGEFRSFESWAQEFEQSAYRRYISSMKRAEAAGIDNSWTKKLKNKLGRFETKKSSSP